MIAVDTSALMAIVAGEPDAASCRGILGQQAEVIISAATLAEALIVAGRRDVLAEMSALIETVGPTVIPVSEASARRVSDAYAQWGKGVHPAGLNLGDCFAYAIAKERDCPLLFIGQDFAKTDLVDARTP